MSKYLAVILLSLFPLSSYARYKPIYADSPYKDYYSSQHNEHNQWCCDKADGERYDGEYVFNKDGSVTLKGPNVTLPSYMILKTPNPTGHAIWWHIDKINICFAPGTLS